MRHLAALDDGVLAQHLHCIDGPVVLRAWMDVSRLQKKAQRNTRRKRRGIARSQLYSSQSNSQKHGQGAVTHLFAHQHNFAERAFANHFE
jgi:hypothetical protein